MASPRQWSDSGPHTIYGPLNSRISSLSRPTGRLTGRQASQVGSHLHTLHQATASSPRRGRTRGKIRPPDHSERALEGRPRRTKEAEGEGRRGDPPAAFPEPWAARGVRWPAQKALLGLPSPSHLPAELCLHSIMSGAAVRMK